MRVWIRMLPEEHLSSINLAAASIGFRRLGAEIMYFSDIKEISGALSRSDIVIDGVRQLNQYFKSLNIETNVIDYPEVLLPFAQRKIWKDTLGNLRRSFSGPVFVKPIEEKLFPGTVIRMVQDWSPLVCFSLSQEVYCSQVLDLRSEYRVFVRYDRIMDVRPYAGDYHYQFDPEKLDRTISSFVSWKQRPKACSIDIAVTADRKTIFLELNDGYAVGAYGLNPVDYARFITTRWVQLMGFPDPYEVM